MMLQKAKASHAVPTVRVKAPTASGFALVNVSDFDHDKHELHDKKDNKLVPSRVQKAEDAGIAELNKKLGAMEDRAIEAESERDEWKTRAEAAEAKFAGEKSKGK
jgi:hypothetical protein